MDPNFDLQQYFDPFDYGETFLNLSTQDLATTENNQFIFNPNANEFKTEAEILQTTITNKSANKKGYHQKNCPRLFGKQLNSLARSNVHFEQKKKILLKEEEKIKNFNKWLDEKVLNKLNNLKDFQNIWTINEHDSDKEFKEVFKDLSLMFFSKFAMRYIANSKMKDEEQKKFFVKLIPKYLRGIKNPSSFHCMISTKK